MDAELTALAAAGATALVQQMVTDGWGNVRDRAVALFSRGRDEESVQGELEESRADLVAARDADDEDAAADIQASWRARLRRTLRDDPQAAAELRALLDELDPQPTGPATLTVHNTVSGGASGVVVQGGTFNGGLTIGESWRRT
ncbi:hypothetical protein ACFU96_43785 [Streptomyces sp. NPDC057620]|uniref:hypothetical protein n=1 Tax=Streptomyces sp. NPDC057620 TaxID=3346185 RepID=UPI0036B4D2EE